ncbi:MAG: SGNH/GDSL hydrolase family protein [Clostridiales bacterium]|jgi:acyl-CoA thioesterase-1|nr:SGNH/GDSL hydrolase family protein [Clostridiales bacterium]
MLFRRNSVIVFQGDSITDAGRTAPGSYNLGDGYAAMAIGALKSLYPDYNLTLYNRGVSGDRVSDLAERWDRDTLDLNPALVSILIGINDVWHYRANGAPFDLVRLEEDYVSIVESTLRRGSKLIILEPFAFHHDVFREIWRSDLWKVIQVIRRIALRYADAYIPLDGIFHEEAIKVGSVSLTTDGVHPTPDGHRLIADAWLKAAREN